MAIVMATTIQVQETTRQMLESLKQSSNAQSYDEVIRSLMEKKKSIHSMFGYTAKKPLIYNKEEDRMKFHEF